MGLPNPAKKGDAKYYHLFLEEHLSSHQFSKSVSKISVQLLCALPKLQKRCLGGSGGAAFRIPPLRCVRHLQAPPLCVPPTSGGFQSSPCSRAAAAELGEGGAGFAVPGPALPQSPGAAQKHNVPKELPAGTTLAAPPSRCLPAEHSFTLVLHTNNPRVGIIQKARV